MRSPEDVAELITSARVALQDADRCSALGITAATWTLHRTLREVTRALVETLDELDQIRNEQDGQA